MEGQGDVAVLPPEGAGLEYPVDAGGGEFPGEGDEYASHGGDEVCCPARPARTPHSLALSLVGLAVPDFRRTARRRPPPRAAAPHTTGAAQAHAQRPAHRSLHLFGGH